MGYTEQQKAAFRQEFKTKRKRQIILAIPILVCMVFLISVSDKQAPTMGGLDASVLLPPVFVLILAAVGYSFYNWRCPACKRYLGKTMSPSYCVKCGVALQ